MIIDKLNPVMVSLNLGFINNLMDKLHLGFIRFSILEIRYYSLAYIIGLVIAFFMIAYLAKRKGLKMTRDDVLDYLVYIAVGLLIGARVFYFLFYDLSALRDPLEFFRLWHGGMSFHGGLAGAIIAAYIYCKRKKINFWVMADITIIPAGLALMLGRIGNFINGELYGRVWQGALCIDYSQNPYLNYLPKLCRYPSQLVEAFKNLLIFSVLWSIKDKDLPDGTIFWLFVLMYGVLRFLVEFIRQPDEQLGFFLGYFTMGQILCFVMVVVSSVMLIRLRRRK